MRTLGRSFQAGQHLVAPACVPASKQSRLAAHVTCSLRQSHRAAFTCRPGAPMPLPSSSGAGTAVLGLQPARQVATRSEGGTASIGSGWMDMPESQPLPDAPAQVFPRIRESDPYKRLGVTRDASFEEVQEARNFLVEQYKDHEPSRESIELALDAILQEKYKVRHRDGFRPPQRGRRGEVEGDAPRQNLWQRIRAAFEPSVPASTLVNDGSVFAALGLWAGWQASSSDPTLPLGAAICFCCWKLYDKRNKRNPDGPYMGGSPIWGALLQTVAALVVGGMLAFAVVQGVPLPPRLGQEGVFMFLTTMALGFTALFLK